MKLIFTTLFLVFGADCILAVEWPGEIPSYCRNIDCPVYTVLENNEDYEVRLYKESYWVKADMRAIDHWTTFLEGSKGFWKLFKYISGGNKDGLKISMTAPVLNRHEKDSIHMYFMLPHEYYDNPPQPSNQNLEIVRMPPKTFYVKHYRGALVEDMDRMHYNMLEKLKLELANDGVDVKSDVFYTAGYNGPRIPMSKRHYEVWIEKP